MRMITYFTLLSSCLYSSENIRQGNENLESSSPLSVTGSSSLDPYQLPHHVSSSSPSGHEASSSSSTHSPSFETAEVSFQDRERCLNNNHLQTGLSSEEDFISFTKWFSWWCVIFHSNTTIVVFCPKMLEKADIQYPTQRWVREQWVLLKSVREGRKGRRKKRKQTKKCRCSRGKLTPFEFRQCTLSILFPADEVESVASQRNKAIIRLFIHVFMGTKILPKILPPGKRTRREFFGLHRLYFTIILS